MKCPPGQHLTDFIYVRQDWLNFQNKSINQLEMLSVVMMPMIFMNNLRLHFTNFVTLFITDQVLWSVIHTKYSHCNILFLWQPHTELFIARTKVDIY